MLLMFISRIVPLEGVGAKPAYLRARSARRTYIGACTLYMTIPSMLMPSMVPPSTISSDRPVTFIRGVLRNTLPVHLVGLTTQLEMVIFLNPPLVSVPILIPLQQLDATQLVMTISSQGAGPVLLSVIQSSSESMMQLFIVTRLHPSMSMPSLLRLQWLYTLIPLICKSSQLR